MSIIALDIGTSGMRAVVYGTDGKKGKNVYREYHTEFPQPGWVEQQPASWTDAAVYCLAGVAECLEAGDEPLAVAVTSQRSSLIPMKDGRPMRTAIMWQDKRTLSQCDELVSAHTLEGLYRKTGLRINPYFVLPKILWLKSNQWELYDTADKFIGVQDLVVHHLTGQYKTDYTQASRTMLMNIETFTWDEDLLDIAGITADRLPDLVPPGSMVGGLTKEISDQTGLRQGLPVILSGGDQQNAAIALGVIRPGRAEANTGTGSFVISAIDKPVFDENARVLCQASAIAGQWIMEAGIFNTGATYRWFKENFCQDLSAKGDVYDRMDAEAEKAGAGSHGVIMIPHFEGSAAPYWNPLAKGLFFNLSLNNTRGDFIRSIMEGIAVEINDDIMLMEKITSGIDRVSVAGGMVQADLFCRIQADIFDKPVARYENSEASSLGAAMVASVSLGIYKDIEEAYTNMLEDQPQNFMPDPSQAEQAKGIIERKHKLYQALNEGGV